MFVISVCALSTGTVSQLNWWPLVRDCTCYSISILVMLIVICNDVISWPEAIFMLFCYVLYCIALHFNAELEKWATPYILRLPIKLPTRDEQSALVTFKNVPDSTYTQEVLSSPQQELNKPDSQETEPNLSWDPNAAWANNDESVSKSYTVTSHSNNWEEEKIKEDTNNFASKNTEPATEKISDGINTISDGHYKSKENKGETKDPLLKPESAGIFTLIYWHIVFPIHFMCRWTMPDVRQDRYKNLYPLTFLISMVWISFYSYFMVWMITIIGYTLGVPDTVMGLTFVAGKRN
jgi:solute carrier family 24 (sodium/potassium/calcium exchanger), member 4